METTKVGVLVAAIAFLVGCGNAGGPNTIPDDIFQVDDVFQVEDLASNWKDLTCTGHCLAANFWVPGHFNYDLTNDFVVAVTVLQLDNNPWPNVVVSVYDDQELPGDQTLLGRGMTDANGAWESPIVIPSYQTAVNVVASIMGTRNRIRVPAESGRIDVTFGGEE